MKFNIRFEDSQFYYIFSNMDEISLKTATDKYLYLNRLRECIDGEYLDKTKAYKYIYDRYKIKHNRTFILAFSDSNLKIDIIKDILSNMVMNREEI